MIIDFHPEDCNHQDCKIYRKNSKWISFIEEKTIEEVTEIVNLPSINKKNLIDKWNAELGIEVESN